MILSKKHKFIFIKGKKVAGTSVEVFLSEICGTEDIITPITPIDERERVLAGIRSAQNYGIDKEDHEKYINLITNTSVENLVNIKPPKGIYYNHMPLVEVMIKYGPISEDWVVFAIERCPYRKIISFANMQSVFSAYRRGESSMVSDLYILKRTIDEIINNGRFCNVRNIDMYKNTKGIVCPTILHYENLEKELRLLVSNMQTTFSPMLRHFKRGLLSNSLNLLDIYSKGQLKRINEAFEDEFTVFGYQMLE
jgi:hypothetical protein